ncbi:MAG TPA: 3-oxoacyl-[acyl-carrier-protein] synthase III C-terminal domain-containing protein [Steroidobacteraceae bacterium]|nr:3-oxoacyl-[acyl-carrier-protein] synthase III C-terminal domain-containing protein [Steroidobacteraceae bacterium]
MKPFVIDRHGRLALPSHFFHSIDFSALDTVEQLAALIQRDFDSKGPSGAELLRRLESRVYRNRYELLRDLALHLFWVNRFSLTLYEQRPCCWRHVPKRRDDVFIPTITPWKDAERKIAAVQAAFQELPSDSPEAEYRIFARLFDLFRNRRYQAAELPPLLPTVAEFLQAPDALTLQIALYDPDFGTYSEAEIIDCREELPQLEALMRWTMILYNQSPWHREHTRLIEAAKIRDDDVVPVLVPRSRDALEFIQRARAGRRRATHADAPRASRARPRLAPAVSVRRHFRIRPRFEALATVKGEIACSNLDLVRNAAYTWSPMSAEEILQKTGIQRRCYTARSLDEVSLEAARTALAHAERKPEEIGAVVFCTCTSARLMPATAAWIAARLGIEQTHATFDLVAACAGMVYGLAECVRLLQEVNRPVLLVCGEKFSDKIGAVRPSRMLFGDGAAALVIGPAPADVPTDVEILRTYGGGPLNEVDSIVWPNPRFDNGVTVYGPDVQSLVRRYLSQMLEELAAEPDPDDAGRSLLEAVDVVVPHQANRTMVTRLAAEAGLALDKLYFNIDRVGNLSSASVPVAMADAVGDAVIREPARVFAPCFGAGAVAGYALMRVDPRIVAAKGSKSAWSTLQPRALAQASMSQ